MKNILVCISVIGFIAGCATVPYQPYAREVKKKPSEGGIIALKTEHRPEDRQKADSLMAANCGLENTVKVLEEGEVAVGEKTLTKSEKVQNEKEKSGFSIGGLHFGSQQKVPAENTDTTSERVAVHEWQISYACQALNPTPAAPVAAKDVAAKPSKKLSKKATPAPVTSKE